jgi:oligopeptide transport system permease protein
MDRPSNQTELTPSLARNSWRLLWKKPVACLCVGFLIFLILGSILGPFITGYSYEQTSDQQFAGPSSQHLFGTDLHGRDLLTRTCYGFRISLIVGIVGTIVSLIVGVSYGMISGYSGGRTDNIMMRFVDILYSLPRLIFVIVVIVAFDQYVARLFVKMHTEYLGVYTRMLLLFIGLGAMQWLTMARIVRGQVLSLKEQQFVAAARTLGATKKRILLKHLLPNLTGIIIVYLTLTIPEIILLESFLSFLGLGIQPPQASLGTLIADGASTINPIQIHWSLLVGPGMVMSLALLSLNILGDHLRDIFDPRAQK